MPIKIVSIFGASTPEVMRKNEKIQNNIPLDGTEPSITFEEFAEWNVRYPID